MSDSAAPRVGAYEILSPIGSGGMGDVFRGRDTRLDRDVAIKFVRPALADDPGLMARFEREARLLASLNHPNIAQIYGFEDGGHRPALIMELVEGPTLADRLETGPMPLEQALSTARQLAGALEAAHEQNIIHRDLKPANIKLRADGAVKVLDFGLAKLADASAQSSGASALTSPAMTRAGVVIGTPAYMSPEQARGQAVDARTDLWAFGCVLYEMLTGRRSFEGATASDAISAVLTRDPDWTLLPGGTPPSVLRVLRRCLARDLNRRLRHAGDVRLELDDEDAGSIADGAPDASRRAKAVAFLPWGMTAAAVLALGLAWMAAQRPPTATALSATRLEFSLPAGLELFPSSASTVIASPDGQSVAFVGTSSGSRQLFLRRLNQFEASPVAGTNGTTAAAFCRDGRSLALVTAGGELKTVSLTDGVVNAVVKDASVLNGIACSASRIIFVRERGLWTVAPSGGDLRQLTTAETTEHAHVWPSILPNGEAVLFTLDGLSGSRIEALVLATGERRVVLTHARMGKVGPDGRLFFYRDDRLLSVTFDESALSATGAPLQMEDDIPSPGGGSPLGDVSPSGVVVYAPHTPQRRLVWVSRDGTEQILSDAARSYLNPRLSPDGTRVLVQAGGIWIYDLRRNVIQRVASLSTAWNAFPIWLPDGTSVMHRSGIGLRVQSTENNSEGRTVPGTNEFDYPGEVTADGETLVLQRSSSETSFDVLAAPLKGPGQRVPVVQTPAYEAGARPSPDGRWLVYVSNESGPNEIYVRPFRGTDRRWQLSSGGGTQPVWNANGREVFYRIGDAMMAVAVTPAGDDLSLSAPQQLFARAYAYGAGITIANYDVTKDGQRFLMVKDDTPVDRLRVIQHWRANAAPSPGR